MAVSQEQFVRSLADCGLMSVEECHAFIDSFPHELRPKTAEQLARELVAQGRLTKFQAQAVYQNKGQRLVIGNYLLLEKLGRGGMGDVFKAKHLKMDRVVALKILSAAAMKSPGALKRFHREAKAAAKLAHPNIVTAYDFDEDQGIHFLVTEYVDGENLSAIVKQRGALSLGRAVDYILQAARGLEYAHANGVIHRDIKPSNLLLDKQGTVKILDMGIARVNEFVGQMAFGSADELSSSGVIVGTPDYMSPEQSTDLRVADARSDIYSLGCTLYFLLTGQPVFSGETVLQKIIAHREQPPPFLREIRGDVPECLEKVFQKMLAKRPQDRQRSMTEVIAEIQKCIAIRQQTTGSATSGPYALDDTVRSGQTKPVEAAPQQQPASAVGSLLDEWLVNELEPVPQPFIAPRSTFLSRRTKRRLLRLAIALGAIALIALASVYLLSGPARGELMVEMTTSQGVLEITTLDGGMVLQCPAARGTVLLPTRADKYRVKLVKDGVDLFVREVKVRADARSSVVVDVAESPKKTKQ